MGDCIIYPEMIFAGLLYNYCVLHHALYSCNLLYTTVGRKAFIGLEANWLTTYQVVDQIFWMLAFDGKSL